MCYNKEDNKKRYFKLEQFLEISFQYRLASEIWSYEEGIASNRELGCRGEDVLCLRTYRPSRFGSQVA